LYKKIKFINILIIKMKSSISLLNYFHIYKYDKNLNLNKKIIKIFIILLFLSFSVKSESVCDHELLIMELKQDLEDNGILDCLR